MVRATSPGAWAVACWYWAWRCGCWRGAVEVAARPLLLSLHGGAGALFGVLLFVVLFSGAWSLGHDDLREWLRAPAQAGGEALALERLLERAGEEGVDIRDATLLLPAPGHAAFSVCDARLDCRLDLDPASGRVLPPMPALDLLLNLHKSLFVGFPGRVLVSLFGVSLLLLCLAGVLLHSRRWRDLRRWRRDRGLRLALFDLHGLIGIWGLPWLLLFGFTGALSGLGALGTLLLAPVAYPQEPNRVFVELMGPPPPAAEGAAIGVPHRSRPPACRRCRAGARLRRPAFEPQSCRGCRRQRGDRRYPAWPAEHRELRAAPLSAGRRRPARRAQLGAARVLAARLHRRAAVAFRPVPVARAGLVRRVARPAPGDGPRRLPALRQRPVPVAATTRLGAGRPRTALAAPEPGFLCRPGGGGRVAPAGAATRALGATRRTLAGAAVPCPVGRRWPGGVAAAGRLAAGARVARRRRAGLPGGRRRAPGALAHARPAAGPGPRPHPDPLRRAAHPARLDAGARRRATRPPRVTGDHHA
ncbi:PepSY domain-containing protein [Pseudomonas aeruginosa]|uniref:PepSY domain-containing protein n=7 Tax=Bacteria TaxID=2 RepID=UPI003B42D83B